MNYENDTMRYRKKKKSNTSSSVVKSDHKHNYVACLIRSYIFDTEHLALGKRCSACGKLKVTKHFILDGGFVLGPEQIRAKFPGLPIHESQSLERELRYYERLYSNPQCSQNHLWYSESDPLSSLP